MYDVKQITILLRSRKFAVLLNNEKIILPSRKLIIDSSYLTNPLQVNYLEYRKYKPNNTLIVEPGMMLHSIYDLPFAINIDVDNAVTHIISKQGESDIMPEVFERYRYHRVFENVKQVRVFHRYISNYSTTHITTESGQEIEVMEIIKSVPYPDEIITDNMWFDVVLFPTTRRTLLDLWDVDSMGEYLHFDIGKPEVLIGNITNLKIEFGIEAVEARMVDVYRPRVRFARPTPFRVIIYSNDERILSDDPTSADVKLVVITEQA